MPARTRASWAVATLLLAGGLAHAQPLPARSARPPTAPPVPSYSLHKPAPPPPAAQPVPLMEIQRTVQLQPLPARPVPVDEYGDSRRYQVQLDPPGPLRLFRLESERNLQLRMKMEGFERTPRERIVFPEEPVIALEPYAGRQFAPMVARAEPNYVCYPRLLFEQPNAERYGWDFAFFHPIISAGAFLFDVATLPYHLGTAPCRKFESSAGRCLPGDPVPLLLFPPERSMPGSLTEVAVVVALLAIFP